MLLQKVVSHLRVLWRSYHSFNIENPHYAKAIEACSSSSLITKGLKVHSLQERDANTKDKKEQQANRDNSTLESSTTLIRQSIESIGIYRQVL